MPTYGYRSLEQRNADLVHQIRVGEIEDAGGVVFHREATTPLEERAASDDEMAMNFVMSTPGRKGDGIDLDPKGWEFQRFQANPVALYQHFAWSRPIGRWSNVRIHGTTGVMRGRLHFASEELNPLGPQLFGLYKAGFMNAVSIGFRMLEWEFENPKKPYSGGINSKRQELFEASTVTLPMDPAAVAEGRSAGIHMEPFRDYAMEVLDACKDDPAVRAWAEGLWAAVRKERTHHFYNGAAPHPPVYNGVAPPEGSRSQPQSVPPKRSLGEFTFDVDTSGLERARGEIEAFIARAEYAGELLRNFNTEKTPAGEADSPEDRIVLTDF